MARIELNPKPFLYSAPLSIFGGITVMNGGSDYDLLGDLGLLVQEVTDCISQAYSINNKVSIDNILKYALSPIANVFDKSSGDYAITEKVNRPGLRSMLVEKILNNGVQAGVTIIDNEIYYVHILDSLLNHSSLTSFLTVLQGTIFGMSLRHNKGVVHHKVGNDSLVGFSWLEFDRRYH